MTIFHLVQVLIAVSLWNRGEEIQDKPCPPYSPYPTEKVARKKTKIGIHI